MVAIATLNRRKIWAIALTMALVAVFAAVACSSGDEDDPTAAPAASAQGQLGGDAKSIAERRGLSDADIEAALKTFTPTGVMDEYLMFSSGGHSGQLHVIGMPSMRLLKTIAVFTPESWQGYGIGSNESEEVLEGGRVNGDEVLWGDTHHPALTETAGEYDGEFVFTNDKANARVAVISLKDFETKQIVKNPITLSDHGATMVTPNSEWVIEGGQYAMPLSGDYAPISDYQEKYRGMVTMWKFDRAAGRIDTTQSFAIELPPYWQDLCDAGKLVSEGWFVCGSFNTEMATGGNQDGNPPFEAGASQADMDYLHVFNIEKAIAARDAGKTVQIQGFPVIPLEVAASDGILHLVPEPKSPHGADVTPGGEYIVVSGKLDPHVTIYSFDKIIAAIAAGPAETDSFGVPVLAFDDVVEAQVEVGLGPLHTQFDNKGYAYTSLFLDSAVARWTLGGPYASLNPDPEWSLITKTQVHYNVGHIAAAEGDTVSPDGKYLVSLNKWSLDRFNLVGPLLPQNFQLLDIEGTGEEMPVIYDMPVGFGEPHYAQIIKADKIHAWEVYPEIGFNPLTGEIDPSATLAGEERVERDGNTVHVYMTAVRSHFTPEHVTVKEGDHVAWHITNIERGLDATHGFAMPGKNVSLSIEPGETITTEFDVTDDGVFPFYCTEFCSALHLEMAGYFLVEPSGS